MKHIKNYILILVILFIGNIGISQVLISDGTETTPDESAILEVRSTTKGLLIPRMTTDERNKISNTTAGLLVFDTDMNSFFIFGQDKWNDLSTPAGIWETSSSNVYLSSSYTNVGIGTTTPGSKFVVQANKGDAPEAVLFEVKDELGNPIFKVTSEGVRVFVKDETLTKGVSGGFAVGRYGTAKGLPDTTYFAVTPYSTEVNTKDPSGKGVSGGFAVGRYGTAKATPSLTFSTTPDETYVYTTDVPSGKGVSGGFAVGRYGTAKGPVDSYLHIKRDNIFIGDMAGINTNDLSGGINNVFIGSNAGQLNTTGSGNIFIGNNAGSSVVSSNKLYIDNASSSSDVALVYGDFTTKAVNLNGRLRFNTGSNTITLPTYRGSNNQVLTMNGTTGVTDWTTAQSLITFPTQYVPPTLFVTYDKDFPFKDDDNIGTLIVKTDDGAGNMSVILPFVKSNHGRTITIKSYRDKTNIGVFPFPSSGDLIQDVQEYPLIIYKGFSYTLQAEYDDKTGKGLWYVNSIYP